MQGAVIKERKGVFRIQMGKKDDIHGRNYSMMALKKDRVDI